MRIIVATALAALLSGCVTGETVSFRAAQQQEAIVKDGKPALVSTRKNSVVLIRPAGRQFRAGGRPVFVVGMTNTSRAPLNFKVSEVEAYQVVNQTHSALKVITYDDLVAEERNRQVVAAIATGLSVAANSYSAAHAGYYNANSTVYTPRGTYNVHTTGYSPAAAAIAQSNANAQNTALIANTVEAGERNMAALEAGVIKDNTLMPNEWYGGQLHISPLQSDGSAGSKNYRIAIRVGADLHEIDITQDAAK